MVLEQCEFLIVSGRSHDSVFIRSIVQRTQTNLQDQLILL